MVYTTVLSVLAAGILSLEAQAQTNKPDIEKEAGNNPVPTIVRGEAQNADGSETRFEVEQNPDDGNPLGAPIVDSAPTTPVSSSGINPMVPTDVVKKKTISNKGIAPIVQSAGQGIEKPWQEPLPQPSDKIENELYQSGNDIIDVQAYPIKDVSTVTEPNIQPTIITQ